MRALAMAWLISAAGCGGDTPPAASCGDGVCNGGENAANCCDDCGCAGAKICVAHSCATAEVPCGNGVCDKGETQSNCCQDCGCPNGQACSSGACAPTDTRKSFGEPCTYDTDCVTNVCVGVQGYSGRFCSEACTKSSTCAAESSTTEYWCMAGANNVNFCMPSCTTSADCKSIGNDWSCDRYWDVENLIHGLCAIWTEMPEGTQCLDNSQCANGSCNGSWCSAPCTNNAACGTYAACVLDANQSYRCFPRCSTNSDCLIYGSGITCKSVTTRDGTTASLCSG